MTNIPELLSYNIQRFRKLYTMSRSTLSTKAGVSKAYISELEHCKKYPSPVTLEKIAAAFNIDTLDLFTPYKEIDNSRSDSEVLLTIITDLEQLITIMKKSILKTKIKNTPPPDY